jgi:hypothetical protein
LVWLSTLSGKGPSTGGFMPEAKRLLESVPEASFQEMPLTSFCAIQVYQEVASASHTVLLGATPPSAVVAADSVTNSATPREIAVVPLARRLALCEHEYQCSV